MKTTIMAFIMWAGMALHAADLSVSTMITNGLSTPRALVADTNGNLFICDSGNNRVIRMDFLSGDMTIFISSALPAYRNLQPPFGTPMAVIMAPAGWPAGVIVADYPTNTTADVTNHWIRHISMSGVVSNIAGGGTNDSIDATIPWKQVRFRYPVGLTADSAGNIYVADSMKKVVRRVGVDGFVTTVATNLQQPTSVAIGDANELWVADSSKNTGLGGVIRRFMPGDRVGEVIAGTLMAATGTNDADFATEARFNNYVCGLLWQGSSAGLLLCDYNSHTIRRVFYQSVYSSYAVQTFAGVPGSAGWVDGPVQTALFNGPSGLVNDVINGGFFIADANSSKIRRLASGGVKGAVADPVIGWVEMVRPSPLADPMSILHPIDDSVFYNEALIAIKGELDTFSRYVYAETPTNIFNDTVPNPGLDSLTAPFYKDGMTYGELPPSIVSPMPDMTIKAIGTASGRRPSQTVKARIRFMVDNPRISGDNAAYFIVTNYTDLSEMWYTTNGDEPTNAAPSQGPIIGGTNLTLKMTSTNGVVFKVRGYRRGFSPSQVVTKTFYPDAYVANKISLGFANGEASTALIGAAGQRFYAPITLSILPDTKMYSLQFNVTVTNLNGAHPVDGSRVRFDSMLLNLAPSGDFVIIDPSMSLQLFNTNAYFTNLLFTNTTLNLLGVGWIERKGATNLYDSPNQDLITYSMAHDNLFKSLNGKVVVGGYSFLIPTNSAIGETYQVKINAPSATSDGVAADIYIETPTNGTLKAVKVVTNDVRRYLVGDVTPFHWFNAGDFGDTNLLSGDVLQVFQSAVYYVNYPPYGSDFYDAMDSCCWGTNGGPVTNSIESLRSGALPDGNDQTINQIVFGDKDLNVTDVFVAFRRSLDPSLKWVNRYWTGGVRHYEYVSNMVSVTPDAPTNSFRAAAIAKTKTILPLASEPSFAFASARDQIVSGGGEIQIPITVSVAGTNPARIFMLGLSVVPLEGAPPIRETVQFTPSLLIASSSGYSFSRSPNHYAGVWLDNTMPGIVGSNVLGVLKVVIPSNAPPSSAYLVRFDHFSCSSSGIDSMPRKQAGGLLTLSDRSASSWHDSIPDSWRLKYFGAVSNLLSSAQADADGDGVSNWDEFRAGTNPNDIASKLRLMADSLRNGTLPSFKLRWPSEVSKTYVIEATSRLGETNWTPILSNLGGSGDIREITVTNMPAGGFFYRVRVVQ